MHCFDLNLEQETYTCHPTTCFYILSKQTTKLTFVLVSCIASRMLPNVVASLCTLKKQHLLFFRLDGKEKKKEKKKGLFQRKKQQQQGAYSVTLFRFICVLSPCRHLQLFVRACVCVATRTGNSLTLRTLRCLYIFSLSIPKPFPFHLYIQ